MRLAVAILLLAGLSACGETPADPRYQFGVSGERPAASDDRATAALLDWKAAQLCTQGYQLVRQDTINADNGGLIVDNHIQCNPYRPNLDPTSFSLPDIAADFDIF